MTTAPIQSDAAGGACSFAASTLVATPHGTQPIGSLKVGDAVVAYNPTTGKSETQPVQHVWVNHDTDLVDVQLVSGPHTAAATGSQTGAQVAHAQHRGTTREGDDAGSETIHTTANHPWLTADRGWVPAGDLKPGEPVVTLDAVGNTTSTTTSSTVAWVRVVPGAADMYNLTVAQDHTYAVGGSQVVVHNVCPPSGDNPVEKYTRNKYQKFTADQAVNAKAKTNVCPYCGESDPVTVEHITSQKYDYEHGGAADDRATRSERINAPENLIGACRSCNSSKGARSLGTAPGEWWPPAWPAGTWWPYGGP